MAKSKKDTDRRQVVERMRREQERKDRRRNLAVLGAAVAVGAVIIGVAVLQVVQANEDSSRELAAIGVPAGEAGCEEPTATSAEGNADHRPEGTRIDYPESPPAAGPHYGNVLAGAQVRKFYESDDRPPVEQLVHNLEHGYTILWYDETVAGDDAALADVRAIARTFPSTTDFNDKFIAAPWTSDDGEPFPGDTHVALTHWSLGGTNGNDEGQQAIHQYCGEVSGEVVEDFMADYPFDDAPEGTIP